MAKAFKFSLEQLTELGPHPHAPADTVKCGGCNWETSHLYVLADSEAEAVNLIRKNPCYGCANCGGFSWEHDYHLPDLPDCIGWEEPDFGSGEFAGMCGECFAEYLAEGGMSVTFAG